MQNYETMKPVTVMCHNCQSQVVGWQDQSGLMRIQCPKCGTVTVSKVMSRRHIQLDIYAPKGQVLLEQN